jgi:signal transduction histidine kinase
VKRAFSLRRRLTLSLFAVFLLGVAATAIYSRWELYEIEQRLHELPAGTAAATVQFNQMVELGVEFFGYILLPATLGAIGLIWIITNRSLSGIQRASQHAAQIGVERLDARLDVADVPDEVVPLVRSINGSLDRLAAAYTAEQRLAANVAHELRTPLAVLRTRLQTAKLGGALDWPAIERDLAQLERAIAQILDLARKEHKGRAGEPDDRQPVNLARILRETAAQLLPLAERMNRTVEIEAPDQLVVEGSADDLRDMLRNLIENALEHGRGTVRGAAERSARDGQDYVIVTIADEGAGIPETLHEAVFERFQKQSSHSGGAGLGLAIVRQVARAHGGDARFTSSTRGVVEVVLLASSR